VRKTQQKIFQHCITRGAGEFFFILNSGVEFFKAFSGTKNTVNGLKKHFCGKTTLI
jgi:hypothetical protein